MLLLHMSPKSSRMYEPVMALLRVSVAAPDRAGFGSSDQPSSQPSMSDYAQATLAAADMLGWDRFDVIGTHTGSVEAVELAHLAPARVRKVGLVSLPVYTAAEVADRMAGVAAPRPQPDSAGQHLVEMWQRRVAIRGPEVDPAFLHGLFVDEILSMSTAHWAYRAVVEYPMTSRLSTLPVPAVVIAPGDDLVAQTARGLGHIPADTAVVDLPDLDFDLWERHPARMAQLIDRYFDEAQ